LYTKKEFFTSLLVTLFSTVTLLGIILSVFFSGEAATRGYLFLSWGLLFSILPYIVCRISINLKSSITNLILFLYFSLLTLCFAYSFYESHKQYLTLVEYSQEVRDTPEKNELRASHLLQIQNLLNEYASTHENRYPASLTELASSTIYDPHSNDEYFYGTNVDRTTYVVCAGFNYSTWYRCIEPGLQGLTVDLDRNPVQGWFPKTYKDSGGYFSLEIPSGWSFLQNNTNTQFFLPAATSTLINRIASPIKFYVAYVTVATSTMPSAETLEEATESYTQSLESQNSGIRAKEEAAVFNNYSGYKLTYQQSNYLGHLFDTETYLVKKANVLYIIQKGIKGEQAPFLEKILQEVLESVQLYK
jgi:hypothetical protein